MVEQLTLNQRVAGSSPARFTNPFRKTSIGFFLGPLLQPGKFLKPWTSRKTWHGLQLAYLPVRGSKSEIGVRNVGERQAPGKATTNADSNQLKTDRAGIGHGPSPPPGEKLGFAGRVRKSGFAARQAAFARTNRNSQREDRQEVIRAFLLYGALFFASRSR